MDGTFIAWHSMKPSIQLRLNQQLSLTPQLQQAIRLLQLSRLELATELRTLVEANPMLELVEPEAPEPAPETAATDESLDGDWDPGPAGADSQLDFSTTAAPAMPAPANDVGSQDAVTETLRSHLMWQLDVTPLSAREHLVASLVIDALDPDGYLRADPATLAASLPLEPSITLAELDAVRRRLQQFDPVGVASLDLADCLQAQLLQTQDTPLHALARRIVAGHLDRLAHNDIARMARQLRATPEDVADACAVIRQLDPRPGAAFDASPVEYVIPDAYAWHDGSQWRVSLDPAGQPQLALNQHYCRLIQQARRDDAAWMRGQLQEARWLIKSLEQRADTVLRVAQAIVRRQRAFLDYGPEAMRPLVLREIAEEVGMHESTISRVTTRKYLHTPRGNVEFKYFFSTGVGTDDGGSASSTAIQAMLRKLVDEENPRKPLSDQALTEAFGKRGINIARRTIAKYREALRIPRSSERRRLG